MRYLLILLGSLPPVGLMYRIIPLNSSLIHLFGDYEKTKICPSCPGGKLSLKLGKFGAFLGCSNYPECNYRKSLTAGHTASQDSGEEMQVPQEDNNKLRGRAIFYKCLSGKLYWDG